MRGLTGLFLLTVAGLAGGAAPTTIVPADTVKCDVQLNVTDPDPKGLNVRASPKVAPGNILGVLKPDGEWTTVHVIGSQGGWFLIDSAEMIDDSPTGGRTDFKGRGWVHASKVGGIELEPRDVLASPAEAARPLMRGTDTSRTAKLRVMACQGKFIQLEGEGIKGWATRFCTNQRTTCV